METLKQYMKCPGCLTEIEECFLAQQEGLYAGLEFNEDKGHLSFFVINPKTNKFIVPYYSSKL